MGHYLERIWRAGTLAAALLLTQLPAARGQDPAAAAPPAPAAAPDVPAPAVPAQVAPTAPPPGVPGEPVQNPIVGSAIGEPAPPPTEVPDTPAPPPPVDKTLRSIAKEPPVVTLRALEGMNRKALRLVISISEQRAWLYSGQQMVIQTPVSTGKRTHPTPRGEFKVRRLEPEWMDKDFGNFTDKDNRVVREGVDARYDYAPAGSRFMPAPKKYYIELDASSTVGLRGGDPPGYPSTRGDILVPRRIAALLFSAVEVGTPVEIQP